MNEKPKTNAIPLENGNYGCPECKSDQFKHVAHADGRDFYRDIYNCTNCNKVITFEHKRDKRSRVYWD